GAPGGHPPAPAAAGGPPERGRPSRASRSHIWARTSRHTASTTRRRALGSAHHGRVARAAAAATAPPAPTRLAVVERRIDAVTATAASPRRPARLTRPGFAETGPAAGRAARPGRPGGRRGSPIRDRGGTRWPARRRG